MLTSVQDIVEAQISITELFDKINDIKSKAAQSEKMVQEICSDIKKLDCAKNHLQSSITSLKRLQMLITAVNQLEVFIFGNIITLLSCLHFRLIISHSVNTSNIFVCSIWHHHINTKKWRIYWMR